MTRPVLGNITNTTLGNESLYAESSCIHCKSKENTKYYEKKRPISSSIEQLELPKKVKTAENWDDLDKEDVFDPPMCSEYVNDIFNHLYVLEISSIPQRDKMFKKKNIRQNRDILVNWLIKVHNKFKLLEETLYLTMNILDKFLSKQLITIDHLQLVGITCLFIASKYEEIYPPSIKHFAFETDGSCSVDSIKQCEKVILKTLNYDLNYANPMNFLRRISKADDGYDIKSRTLAKYLMEISLVDIRFLNVLPSLAAAAAMFLSRKMLGKGKWDNNLVHYSGGYTKKHLKPICNLMMDFLSEDVVHHDFHSKYSSASFLKASIVCPQWAHKVRRNGYDIMSLHE